MYSYPYPYIPLYINSNAKDIEITDDVLYWYPWIPALKNKNIWIAMAQKWGRQKTFPDLPPPGYDHYIVMGDSNMFGVAEHISFHTGGHVIHLTGPMIYSDFSDEKIIRLPCTFDHQRLGRTPSHWPINKRIKYKTSALVGRVSQSKAIIFAALTGLLDSKDFVGSLIHRHPNIKDVHDWNKTGNEICDYWLQEFYDRWRMTSMHLDQDDNIQSSYNNAAYQESALNFTCESHYYSYMSKDNQSHTEPGPFLTEKTHKCLLSKTAFIAVGQYETYAWLEKMGLNFDYGPVDLSFDQDSGNLTRIQKIVEGIHTLGQWSAQDLYQMTRASCEHNYDMVVSKEFWRRCDDYNRSTYEYLQSLC